MPIPSGCALALDYVPVIDWSGILKAQVRSITSRDNRERGMLSADPLERQRATGTVPGMGHTDPERAKRIRKSSRLG